MGTNTRLLLASVTGFRLDLRSVVPDVALVLSDEPFLGFVSGDLVVDTDGRSLGLLLGDAETGAAQDDIDAHTVDTNGGVVFQAHIDVFVNAEAEVTGSREVSFLEFELFHLQTLVEDFFSFLATSSDTASDGFVSSDAKSTDSQTSFGIFGFLAGQFSQYFGGTGEPITRFSNRDVHHQFGDLDLFHCLRLAFSHGLNKIKLK